MGVSYSLLMYVVPANRDLQRATWRPKDPVDDSPSWVCVDLGSHRCPVPELVTRLILEVGATDFKKEVPSTQESGSEEESSKYPRSCEWQGPHHVATV